MRIAIDLDETLINFVDPLLQYYKQITGISLTREQTARYNNWYDILKTGGNNAKSIIDGFFLTQSFNELSPYEGAIETIGQLKKSHDLYVLTSRYGASREKTFPWIERHLEDCISGIFFSGEYGNDTEKTKADICLENNLELILEDDSLPALNCAKNSINVILFEKPWNKELSHQRIYKVNSWSEVLQYIGVLTQNT